MIRGYSVNQQWDEVIRDVVHSMAHPDFEMLLPRRVAAVMDVAPASDQDQIRQRVDQAEPSVPKYLRPAVTAKIAKHAFAD